MTTRYASSSGGAAARARAPSRPRARHAALRHAAPSCLRCARRAGRAAARLRPRRRLRVRAGGQWVRFNIFKCCEVAPKTTREGHWIAERSYPLPSRIGDGKYWLSVSPSDSAGRGAGETAGSGACQHSRVHLWQKSTAIAGRNSRVGGEEATRREGVGVTRAPLLPERASALRGAVDQVGPPVWVVPARRAPALLRRDRGRCV